MSQEKTPKKLSRSVRYNKKRKLRKEQKSGPMGRSSSTLPVDQNEHTPTMPLSISDILPEIRLVSP
ncbi:7713_t:CDS:1, partial [Ambispora leptoticha]